MNWTQFAKNSSTETLRKILLTSESKNYTEEALVAVQKELANRGEKL